MAYRKRLHTYNLTTINRDGFQLLNVYELLLKN